MDIAVSRQTEHRDGGVEVDRPAHPEAQRVAAGFTTLPASGRSSPMAR
jgi:hypothetical protein